MRYARCFWNAIGCRATAGYMGVVTVYLGGHGNRNVAQRLRCSQSQNGGLQVSAIYVYEFEVGLHRS